MAKGASKDLQSQFLLGYLWVAMNYLTFSRMMSKYLLNITRTFSQATFPGISTSPGKVLEKTIPANIFQCVDGPLEIFKAGPASGFV